MSRNGEESMENLDTSKLDDLRRFKYLLDHISDLMFIIDANGGILHMNKSPSKLGLGGDIPSIFDLIPIEHHEYFRELLSEGGNFKIEMPLIKSDGGRILTEMNVDIVKFRGRIYGVILARDIRERKRLENELRSSLGEKDALLKEIHHRVKNNLQIISSLISLKARRVADKEYRDALNETDDMIKSMALIHEQLYRRDLSRINFREYAKRLVKNLLYSHPLQKPVEIRFNMDDINLKIEAAIPIALIMNELVTNALKYAFNGRDRGTIKLTFKRINGHIKLKVRDDGVGFKGNLKENSSFGMKLVKMLVGQLGGSFSAESENGSCFKIVFKEQKLL